MDNQIDLQQMDSSNGNKLPLKQGAVPKIPDQKKTPKKSISSNLKPMNKFQCGGCDISYSRGDQLKMHVARHHSVGKSSYLGQTKSKSTPAKRKESNAIIDVDAWDMDNDDKVTKKQKTANSSTDFIDVDAFEERKITFNCEFCSKSFAHKNYLTRHVKTHLKTSKTPQANITSCKTPISSSTKTVIKPNLSANIEPKISSLSISSKSDTPKVPKNEKSQSQNLVPHAIVSTKSVQITKVSRNTKTNSSQNSGKSSNKKTFQYVDVDASDLDSKFKKIVVKTVKTPSSNINKSQKNEKVKNLKRQFETDTLSVTGNNLKRSKLINVNGSVKEKVDFYNSLQVFNVDTLYALASARIASGNNDEPHYGPTKNFISDIQTLEMEVTSENDDNLDLHRANLDEKPNQLLGSTQKQTMEHLEISNEKIPPKDVSDINKQSLTLEECPVQNNEATESEVAEKDKQTKVEDSSMGEETGDKIINCETSKSGQALNDNKIEYVDSLLVEESYDKLVDKQTQISNDKTPLIQNKLSDEDKIPIDNIFNNGQAGKDEEIFEDSFLKEEADNLINGQDYGMQIEISSEGGEIEKDNLGYKQRQFEINGKSAEECDKPYREASEIEESEKGSLVGESEKGPLVEESGSNHNKESKMINKNDEFKKLKDEAFNSTASEVVESVILNIQTEIENSHRFSQKRFLNVDVENYHKVQAKNDVKNEALVLDMDSSYIDEASVNDSSRDLEDEFFISFVNHYIRFNVGSELNRTMRDQK